MNKPRESIMDRVNKIKERYELKDKPEDTIKPQNSTNISNKVNIFQSQLEESILYYNQQWKVEEKVTLSQI